MQTMKIIDLLNKLANGEVPKKIKYDNDIYEYNKDYQDYGYFNTGIDRYITLIENELNSVFNLNEEVEIIEDTPKEDKKIEKLETYKDRNNDIFLDNLCYKYVPIHKDSLSFNEQVIIDKLNEIIDKINGE